MPQQNHQTQRLIQRQAADNLHINRLTHKQNITGTYIMTQITSQQALEVFLNEVPSLLKDWLAARIHLITHGKIHPHIDHFGEIITHLNDGDRFQRTGAIVCTCAAVDHALLRYGPDPDDWEPRLAKHDSALLKTRAAQAELRTQHLIQTREKWAKLRSSALSPEALREFELTTGD